ncbi:hypothetical protein H9N25_10350 [Pedobacter riviphilus]|uniref:Transposase n=1 Tax=Pedobacter riviphilus TaxID=2766984 RepID=A0ABX6TSQ8_9SPHI|nr:hypothetical protein [Pedobacter riviphilus]QNR86745.1 hypothetical protein H9N25_10350 [Pedobacter riviphilus]
MGTEKTKWWKTPPYSNVIGGLVVAGILWIIKLGYDWYTKTPILSTMGEWYEFVKSGFIYAINFPIRLWYIVVGLICLTLPRIFSMFFDKTTDDHLKTKSSNATGVRVDGISIDKFMALQAKNRLQRKLDYVAEKINGIVFRWEWIYNDLIKEHEVKHITPCCKNPDCKNEGLKPTAVDRIYQCQICNRCLTVQTDRKALEDYIEKRAKERESPLYQEQKRIIPN